MRISERKTGPKIQSNYQIKVPPFSKCTLDNGIDLFEVNSGSQDIIKIECVLPFGRIHEIKRAVSKASFHLIREGSREYSGAFLAYTYDFYGAYVKIVSGLDYSSISLVVMTKHFEKVWPPFISMITHPAYEQMEVQKYISISAQKLREQLAKNEFQSYRLITEVIFGSNHPYGYNTEIEDIRSIHSEDLNEYWNSNVDYTQSILVLSGKYDDSIRSRIIADFQVLNGKATPRNPRFEKLMLDPQHLKVSTSQDVQTSLKVGRRMFHREHEDYSKVQVLNTLLGGYFGSRLMKNIREDKGYTYGIYSSLDTWKNDGLLYISAELSKETIDQTIVEIKKEMKLLREDYIPKDEFDMVKNYMKGQILHLIDGPFATGQLIKNIYAKGLDIEHFENHIHTIEQINREDILIIANKYLKENSFSTVQVGNF